jgi:ABC-type proline/glycine betaine transport system permease subunit
MPDWILKFPDWIYVNLKGPIDDAIHYMLIHWGPFFDGISNFLRTLLKGVGAVINIIPWWFLLALVFILTLRLTRKPLRAVFYTALMFCIGAMGLWQHMNQTLTIIVSSVLISLLIGFPLGILISFSKRSNAIVRPILDTMQTMPSFVYLIPAVMLLGLGNPPAVIATTIYAIPPIVRLTAHGIQQVDSEVVEAARAFGSTKLQALVKVQIPQAMPTIMTGINQTIMMAIAMVVTCSMIGATGLGYEVISAINRLESGRGFVAGIAIVIMAIVIDRITQSIYKSRGEKA